MINILICEDDIYAASINKEYIEKMEDEQHLGLNVVGLARNYHEVMKHLNKDEVDILLLDIDLELQGEGVKISSEAMKKNPALYIVFITAHMKYATEVFKNGYDFIVKPVEYDKFSESVLEVCKKVLKDREDNRKYVSIVSNFSHIKIPVNDIFYVGKEGRKLMIHLSTGETISTYNKLEEVAKSFSKDFLQISKTQYVNVKKVRNYEFGTGRIEFFCSRTLAYASKSYKNRVKKRLLLREEEG